MRPKWEKKGRIWESWQDASSYVDEYGEVWSGDRTPLLYFKIPLTKKVLQLAHSPSNNYKLTKLVRRYRVG